VTSRQSLRESLNLPALQVTRTVGVDAIIDTIHQLGINRDWDRSRLGLSFGIGAGEMRLIDMASAYQVIANMGQRVEQSDRRLGRHRQRRLPRPVRHGRLCQPRPHRTRRLKLRLAGCRVTAERSWGQSGRTGQAG